VPPVGPPVPPAGPPAFSLAARSAANSSATLSTTNEGAVGMTRWFEKLEMVFGISECSKRNKVKFAAATIQGRALTWLTTTEFFPREEIQMMEQELWGLKVKDYDISAYTTRFHELALLCLTMVESEYKKIMAYIHGLSEDIKGTPTTSTSGFQIDLVLGIAPIVRVPYHLASYKMKELSDQLQELLEMGFIRLISSPWGAPMLFLKKKYMSF
nr:hypothetical protein [Tanacetum cinerariifolium]